MRVRVSFLAVLVALALVAVAGAAAPPERAEAAAQAGERAGGFDGDPATTERVDTGDPVEAAVRLSQARFPAPVRTAVLSRVDTFPDSLAGSVLSDRGPLLFTDPAALTPATAAELQRVLPPGAVVYVLGGERAVAPAVVDDGRRDGALATEDVDDRTARHHPIELRGPLLFTDPAGLTPATAAELQRVLPRGAVVYVLGGERAVAPAVVDDLSARGYAVRRLAGASRVETALAIADEARRVRGDTGGLPRSAA